MPSPTATRPPGVDLIVWDIVIYPPAPTIGDTIRITVSVKNQGADDASSATFVRLSVDEQQLPPDVFIAPVASGAKTDSVWGVSSIGLGAGWHAAKGEVDPTGLVPETKEDNNSLQESFEVVTSSQ